jgi:hypothetical protein
MPTITARLDRLEKATRPRGWPAPVRPEPTDEYLCGVFNCLADACGWQTVEEGLEALGVNCDTTNATE